jgi:hypothetical protein
MSYYLFLDDERLPEHVTWVKLPEVKWVIVRNQSEFEHIITTRGIPSHISFDNDLGKGMGEGIFCVKWMVEKIMDRDLAFPPDFSYTIHSKNNIAAKAIDSYLGSFIANWN